MTGLTFTPDPKISGREIAYLGSRIVGIITPDGKGKGGWVWSIDPKTKRLDGPRPIWTRSDARKVIERDAKAIQ